MVPMYLVNRPNEMNRFKESFMQDPSGVKAAIILGQSIGKLQEKTSSKRSPRIPKPAPNVSGGAGVVSERGLKHKYDAEMKKGNVSYAYILRKKAKENNININDW